jgi:hypothetical protein
MEWGLELDGGLVIEWVWDADLWVSMVHSAVFCWVAVVFIHSRL